MANPITIYWTPGSFTDSEPTKNYLYTKPYSVLSGLHKSKSDTAFLHACPAHKDIMTNVFRFDAAIDDNFDLPIKNLENLSSYEGKNYDLVTESKVGIYRPRKSSLDNYENVSYDMSWVIFASEPVEARMTAPYMPATNPVPGGMLAAGQYDIGKWYRPLNLDYHIPLVEAQFSVKAGDPLFFLEILTDRKVEFKRYNFTDKLKAMSYESAAVPGSYGRNKKMSEHYDLADRTSVPELVLSEIRKNLA